MTPTLVTNGYVTLAIPANASNAPSTKNTHHCFRSLDNSCTPILASSVSVTCATVGFSGLLFILILACGMGAEW